MQWRFEHPLERSGPFSNNATAVTTVAFFVMLRVVFGFAWLMAGLTKESDKHWFSQPNTFLTEYLTAARDNPEVNTYYRWFIESFALQHVSFLNYSIPIAQVIAGVFIAVGLFTLPMLLVVLFMHVNFILSGNMNEISLVLYSSAFVLLLGYRYAQWFSLDKWLGVLRAKADCGDGRTRSLTVPARGDSFSSVARVPATRNGRGNRADTARVR